MADVRNEISIALVKSRLQFDRHQLDRELVEQPARYFEVAEQAALAQSRAVAAKEDLAKTEARLYPDCAADLEKRGLKSTETAIRNALLLDIDRTAAFDVLQRATFEAAQWQALRESFMSRGYMLRDLCQLTVSGFLSSDSVRTSSVDVKADAAKANLAKKRRPIDIKDYE